MDFFAQLELEKFRDKSKGEIKTFIDVQKYLGAIPFINFGGCGISAIAMYRWLKKNNQLKHTKFVYLYMESSEENYHRNQSILKGEDRKPIPASHIILLHNGNEIDIEVYCDTYGDTIYCFNHIVEDERFLIKTINHLENWNPLFNRKVYVRMIEKKLNIDLSDIYSSAKQIDDYYQKIYKHSY